MKSEISDLENQATELMDKANNFEIKTQETYEGAGGYIKSCMELKKKIQDFFNPTIQKFKDTKATAESGRKAEVERMNEHLTPVDEALKLVRKKCCDYTDEQERLAKIEADRLQKIEDDKAEADRQRLLDEAEEEKDEAKADEILEKAIEVRPENAMKVKPEVKKVTNLGIVRRWKWRILDENKIPNEFWKRELDVVKINKHVVDNKGDTSIIGIEAYRE